MLLMTEQFTSARVLVQFFDGVPVTGGYGKIATSDGVILGKFDKRFTLGELGCYFSRRRLRQELIGSDDEACVILEDDMLLELPSRTRRKR